ncbi:MAG TPA: glycosyltransferase [Paracoccaceae bacterium]|nr:glycosyltransferase [Paracoccaceae bacterium]HMO71085.1 glycosyltransferase [Paracoccaceae bacterium]
MTLPLLYVGSLRPGGNGRDRVAALEAAGVAVSGFDTFATLQSGFRIERSIVARWHAGRAVGRLNAALSARAAQGGYAAVLVDKGTWLWPETLERLRRGADLRLAIHYTPDAQFLENRSRHFFRGLPAYDLAVTTKDFELDHYRRAGAREVLLILQGHGRRLHPVRDADIPATLRSDIAFVGHCQPAYAALLGQVAARLPLAVWGPGWDRHARRAGWARTAVRGAGLYGPDYARALSGTRIAIGLLSKRIPETSTTRSFEIPACGTMLLAERTGAHQALFEEGREAEYFDSAEELCDKAAFYLKNDAARERIAEAGYQRAQASGYSAETQFGRIAEWLASRTSWTEIEGTAHARH